MPASQTPHLAKEEISKEHGHIETLRCCVFDALGSLPDPSLWPDLHCFTVIESTRDIQGKSTKERRCYISSLAPNADTLAKAVRQHWGIESLPQAQTSAA